MMRLPKPPPPWVALVTGLVLSGVAAEVVRRDSSEDAARQFMFASDHVVLQVRERLAAHSLILRGAAGLFGAAESVTRQEWAAYVESLRAREGVPGVEGVGYAVVIPPGELQQHVESIRAEGFPDYRVHPEGERTQYTSIIYLEPFSGRNLRAFGFDMFAEPVRRQAMELARDTGEATLSGKVVLVQESGPVVQSGTLLYVPVYRTGARLDTEEARRAALVGSTYIPFRMTDLVTAILRDWQREYARQVELAI